MEEDETADESTTAETGNTQDPQDSQDQESLPSDDQTGDSSEEEEEVSDSINEFTSPEADPTPHQRKRAAVKVPSVHKKSRTDENPP